MAKILHIDTALELASVCLSEDDKMLSLKKNELLKTHASWIHPAIQKMMSECSIQISDLSAISVSQGPGSYTGLRIGMSAAKGICYASGKPLIAINTLEMMAGAASPESDELVCPMIDARRMEVFTAVYNKDQKALLSPCSMILDESSFSEYLSMGPVMFFGNGSSKFSTICKSSNAVFKEIETDASHLIHPVLSKYKSGDFANLAYTEPLYLKEFHSPS